MPKTDYGFELKMPDESWMKRLRERKFTADTNFCENERCDGKPIDPRLQELKIRLLNEIGAAVVLPVSEDDIEGIMDKGYFLRGENSILRIGERCRCHSNSSKIWELDNERYCIMTGYAMSEDGVWRSHSWVWDNEREIVIETTQSRLLYYGFKMTHEECSQFNEQNNWI